jgi:hypothetical protein
MNIHISNSLEKLKYCWHFIDISACQATLELSGHSPL